MRGAHAEGQQVGYSDTLLSIATESNMNVDIPVKQPQFESIQDKISGQDNPEWLISKFEN